MKHPKAALLGDIFGLKQSLSAKGCDGFVRFDPAEFGVAEAHVPETAYEHPLDRRAPRINSFSRLRRSTRGARLSGINPRRFVQMLYPASGTTWLSQQEQSTVSGEMLRVTIRVGYIEA